MRLNQSSKVLVQMDKELIQVQMMILRYVNYLKKISIMATSRFQVFLSIFFSNLFFRQLVLSQLPDPEPEPEPVLLFARLPTACLSAAKVK